MAVKTHTGIIIDLPPAKVFAALTDIARHIEWAKTPVAIRNVSDNPAKLGTLWDQTTELMGKRMETRFQVTIYKPNSQLSYRADEPFPVWFTFSLDPALHGTKLTLEVGVEPQGLWGLAAPFMSNALKNQMHQDIERLRVRLESPV